MDGCLTALIGIALYAAVGFLTAWAIQLAWNALVPMLFHGPTITYGMACGIYFFITLIGTAFKMSS